MAEVLVGAGASSEHAEMLMMRMSSIQRALFYLGNHRRCYAALLGAGKFPSFSS